MKKIKKIILIALCIPLFNFCTNDDDRDENTTANYQTDLCRTSTATCCGLSGRIKVRSGKTYTYSVSTTLSNAQFTWETQGSITLISTNENQATFQFDSNFTAGSIQVASDGTYGFCSTGILISKL